MKGAAALKRRWTPELFAALEREMKQQESNAKGPHSLTSPFGEVDGLVDLRGVHGPRRSSDVVIRFLTLQRVDVSLARGLRMHESELTDCRFDEAVFAVQATISRRLERCSLRAAKLTDVSLGPAVIDCDLSDAVAKGLRTAPNSVIERTTWTGADLSGATLAHARFIDCDFANTTFSAATTFTRCDFSGGLPDFGPAHVTRCTVDGEPIPDRWDGEAAHNAAMDRHLARWASADDDERDTLPLAPEP